jgi:hypothetical protein
MPRVPRRKLLFSLGKLKQGLHIANQKIFSGYNDYPACLPPYETKGYFWLKIIKAQVNYKLHMSG